jgi:uncharacterized Zn finger protein
MARRVIVVDDSDPRYWDSRYPSPDDDTDDDYDEFDEFDEYDELDDRPSRGWGGFPVAKPRLPAEGIRAASARGAIGSTWWSQRFIATLESFGHGARLTRGRSYARSGQVLSVTVRPGQVRADVQGSRRQPYQVALTLPEFGRSEWRRLTSALAAQAGHAAALLSGHMPADIDEVCAGAGLSLFPTATQLGTECTCPDWGNPCKHAAAVCYILAERFDADPFAMLAWRGMDREPLLAAIRAGSDPAAAAGTRSYALADALPTFWTGGDLPDRPTPTNVIDPGHIVRRLGATGVTVAGTDVADLLLPAYQAMTTPAGDET